MIPYQRSQVSFKKIKKLHEQGEHSKVYLAHDEHLDANLVIKEIKTDGFNVESFLCEAQHLYKSSHPNVVQVLYASKDDAYIYIAMPHYENGSLREKALNGYITAKEIIRYSIQFLSGLNNIHSKGLIHFDIKPDNILISNNNEALLADFGFSKNMDEDGFAYPSSIYTHHIPPEMVNTDDLDNKSDIYQVGLTLYRLLVGDKSIENQRQAFSNGAEFAGSQKRNEFPDKKLYPPHVPKSLIKIVSKCLQYDPDNRYQSVIELLNSLAQIEDHGLDWRYRKEGDVRIWEAKPTSGHKLCLKVDGSGACEASKCAPNSNEYRRITHLSQQNVTETQIYEALMSKEWISAR